MEAIFFWGGALGLLAAALMAVLPAFLFPRAPDEDSAQSENAAAASERLAALQAQIAAGEIGPEEAAADEERHPATSRRRQRRAFGGGGGKHRRLFRRFHSSSDGIALAGK